MRNKKNLKITGLIIIVGLVIAGSMEWYATDKINERVEANHLIVDAESQPGLNYFNEVEPVLNNRCVVCHSCYDAPCQLKLSSTAGIQRGASNKPVYNAYRVIASEPTRLFVDAHSVEEWRQRGFHPVLDEIAPNTPRNNDNNLLLRMLQLKQRNPLPSQNKLPESFKLDLNAEQECPSADTFDDYTTKFPLWGMPYGLPAISNDEFDTIKSWIDSGAPMPTLPALSDTHQRQLQDWEHFLNQDSLKAQLVSRYIYEHLFMAHLYFDDLPIGEYFSLVRSSTPPGQPINIIATRRPYADPGVNRVYYRLQRTQSTIVAKTHMPYALNQTRMDWIDDLFFNTNYSVSSLPGYGVEKASNPFKVFQELPAVARYKFMLKEASFIIQGFIKGPVCRGQTALNVINDQFWVFFLDPEKYRAVELDEFLKKQAHTLSLPAEAGSTSDAILNWKRFSDLERQYLIARGKIIESLVPEKIKINLDLVWDGYGNNSNAALTVFRHFDSATVIKGLVGEPPKTAWLISYPILERLHYLLVSGYDVFGNLGHQFNTRVYMDFLRMESEWFFLTLLPPEERERLWRYWYRDASEEVQSYITGEWVKLKHPPEIAYKTDAPLQELYGLLKQRMQPILDNSYGYQHKQVPESHQKVLNEISQISGLNANILPEFTLMTITDGNQNTHLYSVLRNSAHSNIATLLRERSNRLPNEDNVTVARGVIGSYPNAYWQVNENDLKKFVATLKNIKDEPDYARFMDTYGVRRTDKNFWKHSDQIHQNYRTSQTVDYGLLDYNRLENR